MLRFDALGDDRAFQRLREAENAGDDRRVALHKRQSRNERSVDFDGIDRQPLQVRERRIIRAEVVQGYSESERSTLLEYVLRQRSVRQCSRFRDLEVEQIGWKVRCLEDAVQMIEEAAVVELQ